MMGDDLTNSASTTKVPPEDTLLNKDAIIQEYDQATYSGIIPTEKDILCGRGRTAQEHPGNAVFRAIVRMYVPRYKRVYGDNVAASLIYWEITQALQRDHGARFLKRNGNEWVVVEDEEARRKVSHFLRGFNCDQQVRKERKKQYYRKQKEKILEERRKKLEEEVGNDTRRKRPIGTNDPSSQGGKTIPKKPRAWSLKAEIARIMGEAISESEEEDNEEEEETGTGKDTTTAISIQNDERQQPPERKQNQREAKDQEEGAATTSRNGARSSDEDNKKKHQNPPGSMLFPPHLLQHHFVGEGANLGVKAEAVTSASSWRRLGSPGDNVLAAVLAPHRHPEEEYIVTRVVRGRPQEHFLASRPSNHIVGEECYYYHNDNMMRMKVPRPPESILEKARGAVTVTPLAAPPSLLPLAAAKSAPYYHYHDDHVPLVRPTNVTSAAYPDVHQDHHHRAQQHLDDEDDDDERLPVADFFLE